MSGEDEISFRIGGRKIPFVKVENKPSGHYVYFPITKDGFHYSVHPSGNPHLRNKFGQLAELDLEDLKKITPEDYQTLFRYPNHNRDVIVFPIPKSFGAWFGDMFDIPSYLSRLFQDKALYVMKAGLLPEFFEAKPGKYIVIDPLKDRVMMQFAGNTLGPMNIDLNDPSNPRMKNLFAINTSLAKEFSELPDSQLSDLQLDEFTISQMGEQIKAILDQVQVIRWRKGGQELSRGPMIRYFRMRRQNFG